MSLTTNLKRAIIELNSHIRNSEGVESGLGEVQFNELARNISTENLDLGCKLIKKSVI